LEFNKGDLIFFAGCLLLGVYTTLLKKYHVAGSTLNLVFWAMISGVIPMAIYAASADINVDFAAVPFDVYAWIIYLAVLTALTSYIWAYGAPRLGPMKTLAYSYLIPSFVMLIDGVLLGSWPPLIVLPGVLVGIVVMIVLQNNQVTVATARTPELGR
jgi:drug/metabolite transporter (DMT)-like permease